MKKLRKLRKSLSILLSLAMVVGLLPGVGTMQVSAEETSTTASVKFSALDGAPEGNYSEQWGDERYPMLLDGTATTKWCCSFEDGSAYVIFKASQPIYVNGYSVWTANDSGDENGERNPVAWTLSACNDYDETNKTGGNWVTIHEVTGNGSEDALPAENLAEKKYSFTQTTDCYRYFKLNITSISSGNTMQLGDFALSYTALTCDEHQWVVTNTIEPTCTKGGYTEETCSTCDQVRQSNPKDALGHDFVGEQCTRCGEIMAAAQTPSITAYATAEQLKDANNFTLHTENGSGVAQKVNFGTNGTSAQTWYIAGYEDGTKSLVMMCDPEKPFATDKVFRADKDNITSGIQGTYTDTAPTEVYANHYGCSVLRAYLTADALNNFSESEKTLMKNATVYTNDTKNGVTYYTEDKLYAAHGNYNDNYITVGTNVADNLNNGIKIGLSSSNGPKDSPYTVEHTYTLGEYAVAYEMWLRTPYGGSTYNDTALYAITGDHYGEFVNRGSIIDNKCIIPAFHLNMSSVLFASGAPAGTSDASLSDAITFRYNGTDKVTSTAVYEANGVKVTKGGDNEYLYIQWKEDGTDKVYSKQITSDMNISRGSLGVDSFENCKIWIEKVEDNIAYAVEATIGHNFPAEFDSNGFKICSWCGAEAYEPAVYNASQNCYEISNAGQLYWFAGLVNGDASVCTDDVTQNKSANAVLMKSITVNEGVLKSDGILVDDVSGFTSWTPIGNYEVNNVSYEGTFDGQGFTISGLYCVAGNEQVGFVGNSSGTIKNLGITDSYFKGKGSVGAVCGYNFSGTIINCYSECYIDAAGNNAGGVCGTNDNSSTITNCYNIGSVTASSYAHSICGQDNNGGGNITNCFFLDTKPSDGYATGKSEDEFNSGEVTYLLSQGKDGEVWGQKLGENGDAYPVLKKTGDEGNTVYRNETYNGCEVNKGEPVYSYSNTQEDPVYGGHSYNKSGDGTYHECTVCKEKIFHSNVATFTADNTVHSITANCSECGDLGTITLAEPAGDLSYTGEAKAATVTGAISGITTPDLTYVKSDGTDLGTTAPTSVGIYTASITLGTGDGAKTVSVTYEITKAAASVGTAPSAKPDLTYNGNAQALVTEGSATAGTGTLQYSTSKNGAYSTDIPTGTDAKQYSVWYKVVGGTNYADTEPVEIQVTIAPLNITDKNPTITLGTALTYTGAEQTQTVSGVTCDGLPVTYTVSGDKGTNAGGYTLTVTGTGNFTGTATKDFSIGKKSLTGTSQTLLVKKNQAKVVTYDLSKLLPEGVTGTTDYAVGMVTNEKGVLSAAPTDTDITDGKLTLHVASVESADQTAAVQITFTNSNYDISAATLTVKTTDKTPVSLSGVTCGSRVYNGTAYAYTGTPVWKSAEGEAATGETTVTYYEVKNLDENITVYIPLQAAPTDAGSYRAEFTITSDDYVGTASYSFEITKAVITVAAKNKSIYVGDAVPDLTIPMVGTDYTVTGLCGTDALGGTAAMSYAQKPDNTKTGTYEILISGLTAPEGDNYMITYTNGTLTITTKPSSGDSTGGDSSSGGSSGGGSSSGGSSGGGSTGGGSSSGGSSNGGSSSGGTSSGGSSSGGSSSGAAGEAADKPADSGNTTTTTNKDGSTTTTTTETDANGNTVTTTTTVATDGSTTEKVQEAKTNAAGKEVELTTTTKTDAGGNVTGVTEKSVINHIEKNTTATVTVKTDGNVTSAKASITKTSDSSKVSLSGKVLDQITEAAGADTKVRVTMTVKDSKGNTKYKVQADADEIVSGEKLYIYKLDTKTGKYTMVDAKEYKVTKAGTVTINMTKKATYELVTVQESKAITKEILATVKPAKNSTSLSKDKKTTFKLSAKLDMDNVKSVTYTTSKKSIAAISKKGTITAVKAGTATVKATITLKNGTKKTVKMTIKVN